MANADKLLIHLPMDSIAGRTISDLSGNGYHATADPAGFDRHNIIGVQEQQFPPSLYFADNKINLPDLTTQQGAGLRITAWLKINYYDDTDPVAMARLSPFCAFHLGNGGNPHFSAEFSYEKIDVETDQNKDSILSGKFPTRTWFHISVSIDIEGQCDVIISNYSNNNLLRRGLRGSIVFTVTPGEKTYTDNNLVFKNVQVAHLRVYEQNSGRDAVDDATLIIEDVKSIQPPGNLVFHYPLDEIRDGLVQDISGNGLHATPMGNIKVNYDEELGAVMGFDGVDDYIKLPPLALNYSTGFSVEAWVNFDKFNAYSPVLALIPRDDPSGPSGSCALFLGNVGSSDALGFGYGTELSTVQGALPLKTWTHVAVVWDKDGAGTAYLNGVKQALSVAKKFQSIAEVMEFAAIGKGQKNKNAPFAGQIAHLRLYRCPLTEAEMRSDMQRDRTVNAAFRDSYPLHFQLQTRKDEDVFPVLFIESDAQGETLELTAVNQTGKVLEFRSPANKNASSDNFHLQLRFRNKVLSDYFINNQLETALNTLGPDWSSAHEYDTAAREYVVSLLYVQTAPLCIGAGEQLVLQIPKVNAEPKGGARNTRVVICFDHVFARNNAQPYKGYLMRHLEIVNKTGLKHIPLVAGINGANTVLNDGQTPNTIELFLANPSRNNDIKLTPLSADRLKPTIFRISFFGDLADQVQAQWGGNDAAKKIAIALNGVPGYQTTPPTAEANPPEWLFTADSAALLARQGKPGNQIKWTLSNWISRHPTGAGNIYLHYENVPGYQDGTFVIPVNFGRMVEKDGRIGIGTNAPGAALEVREGEINLSRQQLDTGWMKLGANDPKDPQKGAFFELGIGAVANKNNINLNSSGNVYIKGGGGKVILDAQVENVEIVAKQNVLLQPQANVGIGTGSPRAKLEVNGRIRDQSGYIMPVGSILPYAGKDAPDGWLLCNGAAVPAGSAYDELRKLFPDGKLPNLAGRFLSGAGALDGENYTLGAEGGKTRVTLTTNEMPNHSHGGKTGEDGKHQHNFHDDHNGWAEAGGSYWQNLVRREGRRDDHTDDAGIHSHSIPGEGGNQAHENRPPFYVVNYIIKY